MSDLTPQSPENPYANQPQADTPGEPSGEEQLSTKAVIAVVAIVTITAVIVGVVAWMLLSGSERKSPNLTRPPSDQPHMTGQLMQVKTNKILLMVGGRTETFTIHKADAKNIDVSHAQTHANLGIPTEIYYEKEDGKKYATWLADAAKPE